MSPLPDPAITQEGLYLDAPVTVPTFWATIWVGLYNRDTQTIVGVDTALAVIQSYVDRVGLCVSVTPTQFLYTKGAEPGLAVGLINYPRFPSTPERIREHALAVAALLKEACQQYKVSIVFPSETVMLSTEPI